MTKQSKLALFRELESIGRTQLSDNFLMREFLHSEISQVENIPNVPHHPEIAINNGTMLCQRVLEPLQARWGRLSIRSGYRSPEINAIGAASGGMYKCASNQSNFAKHIWDYPDKNGEFGAMACVVICPHIERYNQNGDWEVIARWISDNIPSYSTLTFFPKLCAFNISWHQTPKKKIYSYIRARKISETIKKHPKD